MASAENVRFLDISTNCTTISGRIADGDFNDQFGSAVDVSDIALVTVTDGVTYVELSGNDLTFADDVLTFLAVGANPFVGVVRVELHDNTTINTDIDEDGISNENDADTTLIQTIYTVAPCQINCCIAKLVDAAIECHCKCGKCKEDLLRAEKVFLMLQAATFAAEEEGNLDYAENMYNKASSLCTEVCACGC